MRKLILRIQLYRLVRKSRESWKKFDKLMLDSIMDDVPESLRILAYDRLVYECDCIDIRIKTIRKKLGKYSKIETEVELNRISYNIMETTLDALNDLKNQNDPVMEVEYNYINKGVSLYELRDEIESHLEDLDRK